MQHVKLNGTSFEIGLQHGRRLADLIPRVFEQYGQLSNPPPKLLAAVDSIEETLLARCPNLVDEMHGIAEGVSLPYQQILQLNVVYDALGGTQHTLPRCTAIGLPNTPEGPLVAKTDDVPLDERAFEAIFQVRPKDGYAFICNAYAGTVWNHGGINAAGLGLVMTGLQPAGPRDPKGIPSLLFLRQALLQCATAKEVLAFAEANPLLGQGCTMTVADRASDDVVVIENYPTTRAVRRSSHEPTVRTNHPKCTVTLGLTPDDQWANRYGIPGLIPNSQARAANAEQLVQHSPWSLDGLKQLLGNHAELGAICQHGQAGLHTSVAMIMVPRQRAMIFTEGYGCEPYTVHTI